MAGRINNQPPALPFWPWPSNVREKIVDRAQLDRNKKKKAGDPKNPPLASSALLEFMGPGHSSEELRLPAPPNPALSNPSPQAESDLPVVGELMQKAAGAPAEALGRAMSRLQVPADRQERLKALLSRESAMLGIMERLSEDVREIQRRMQDEQKTRGY
jgi:hypothetical protein